MDERAFSSDDPQPDRPDASETAGGSGVPPPPPPASPLPGAGSAPAPAIRVVYCTNCGVHLAGLAIGQPCTHCGVPVGTPRFQPRGSNGKAVAALVLGICSFVGCMLYGVPGIVCGILAIVFARQVKEQVEAGQTDPSVLGMSNAGRICGTIGLWLSGAMILLMIAYLVFVFAVIGIGMQNMPPPSQNANPSSTPQHQPWQQPPASPTPTP